MEPNKSFTFIEAYKFAAISFLNNFLTILKVIATWLGIVLGAALLLLGPLGLMFYFLGFGITDLKAGSTGFIFALVLCLKLCFALYWLIFETMHFQFLRLALSVYDKKPLTFSEIFTFKNTPFRAFLIARLVYAAKSLFPLLITVGPALIGALWYFLMSGKEEFDLVSPYLQLFITSGWFILFLVSLLVSIYIIFTYIFTGYSIAEGTSTTRQQDASYAAALTQRVKWRIFFAVGIVGLLLFRSLLYVFAYPINILVLAYIYKQLQPFVLRGNQASGL